MDNLDKPLKLICFGMGAIGTYIGGSLAHIGCKVIYIERTDQIQFTESINLRIRRKTDEIVIPDVEMVSNVRNLLVNNEFDVALFAVKSFDTSAVLDSLVDIKNNLPVFLCLQNGVENEQLIEARLGRGSVIGASITSAVGRIGLGDIKVEKLRGIGIETGTPLAMRLINAFNLAGLKAQGFDNREEMKWSKMLTNLLVNATSAILNWTPAQVLENPITYRIEILQIKEALAIMKKMGLHVINLPGTPVKALINSLAILPLPLGRVLIGAALARGRGKKMPSLQIDFQEGRSSSEVEFLNGAVVRFGEKMGIPTPVNRVLTETLVNLAAGNIDRNTFVNQPTLLNKKIEEAS